MRDSNRAPTVSVVMPVYNGEPYLHEAIESILSQTFGDFEFIIIDDGSTDSTWQILTKYAEQDSRLVIRRNPENLHLIRSLNKGLAIARGEYIARHDADDVSLPTRLAAQVSYLQHHPEVGLVGSAYFRLYTEGHRSYHQPPETDTEIRWKLLFGNIWPHPAMMFRRNLFKTGEPFYGDFLHIEDYELWIRLLERTQGATLPEPLVVVRTHESVGISATNRGEQVRRVTSFSAQQINALLSPNSLPLAQVEVLLKGYEPQELDKRDLMIVGRGMVQLFVRFEKQPVVNPGIVSELRRRWIKRMLVGVSIRNWGALWRSGLLKAIPRHDLSTVLIVIFGGLPKKMLYQTGRLLQPQPRTNAAQSLHGHPDKGQLK